MALLAAVLAWCAIPLSPSLVDTDFWGHVQYGRDLLQDGLPRTATYTYTADGYRWINHENLAEIIFAWTCDNLGSGWLLALKCAAGLAILVLAAVRNRVGRRDALAGPVVMAVVWIVTACNLSYFWATRPQFFSFCSFGLLIYLLDRGWQVTAVSAGDRPEMAGRCGFRSVLACRLTTGWRRLRRSARTECVRVGWLSGLIPLLLIWTNTHGGFLAGVGVMLVFFTVRLFTSQPDGRSSGLVAAIAAAACLVTLVNPYGWELHQWLAMSLGSPRPEIPEWHPPQWLAADSLKLWWLAGLTVCGLLGSRLRRDPAELAVWLLVGWQACQHQRHLPFFAVLTAFWLPPHLQSACGRLTGGVLGSRLLTDQHRRGFSVAIVTFSLIAAVSLVSQLPARLGSLQVAREKYPLGAIDYIKRHHLTGRAVVSARWAQYVLFQVGAKDDDDAGLQIAFDGRFRTCYPQSIVDMYFDFDHGPGDASTRFRGKSSPPYDPERILREGCPNLLLVERRNRHIQQILHRHAPDWALLYQDDIAQLWGRRSLYDNQDSERYIAASHRQISLDRQTGWLAWPAEPPTRRRPMRTPDSATRFTSSPEPLQRDAELPGKQP